MASDVFRFRFSEDSVLAAASEVISVALVAAEGVHGQAQVRLEAGYYIDERARTCIIDAGTESGQTLARIFTSLVSRQFGEDSFHVERVVDAAPGVRDVRADGEVVFDAAEVPHGAQ